MNRPGLPERAAGPNGSRRTAGVAACLCSAVGFGVLPVLGKDAYETGLSPLSLLWGRFGLAAAAFWFLVVVVVRPAPPPAGYVVAGLLMGAVGYAVEAGLFFVALERIDASLVELILYAHPALVTTAALLLGWETAKVRLLGVLTLALFGVLLIFAGSLTSGVDAVGLVLSLGAAVAYSAYLLAGQRTVAGVQPVLLAALVATGATASFSVAGLVDSGSLPLPRTADAWSAVALIATVGTVVPMVALFAGIERIGAARATIVSTFEPVVTVVVAALVLGETLTVVEALGALCVVTAVRLLASRRPVGGRQARRRQAEPTVSGMSTGP